MENNNGDWRDRFNELMQSCQTEIKKTTKIGMKMLSASQSNTQLHEHYEALGVWLKEAVEKDKIKVEDQEVLALISKIGELEQAMESLEREVQEIKQEN